MQIDEKLLADAEGDVNITPSALIFFTNSLTNTHIPHLPP